MRYLKNHAQRARFSLRKKTRPDPKRPGRRILTNYQAIVYDALRSPSKKAISLGTKNAREAYRLLSELETLYRTGAIDLWTPESRQKRQLAMAVACSDLLEEYIADLPRPNARGRVRRKSTVHQYTTTLRPFVKRLEEATFTGFPITDVRSTHVTDFVYEEGKAKNTSRNRLARVKDFLDWCVKKGCLESNPISDLIVPKVEGKTDYFTDEEERGFLAFLKAEAAARPQHRAGLLALRYALVIGLDSGLRRGEICGLRWQDVDLVDRLIRVVDSVVHHTKTDASVRTVPIAGRLLEMLGCLRASAPDKAEFVITGKNGHKVIEGTLSYAFRTNANKYGLRRELTIHTTRHTYGTRLAKRGVSEGMRQLVMGHATPEMARLYSHASGQDTREDIDRVFGGGTWEG